MTRSCVVLTAALAATLAGAPRRDAPRVAPAGTIFFDDFSARALDRSKWNVIVTGTTVNDEQQAYVDSPDTIRLISGNEAEGAEQGALEIRSHYRRGFKTAEGKTFDFVSGRIDTRSKFDFTYGVAAARVKLTAGAGLWPAFWGLGNGRWPDTGEMDILENVGDPAWTNFALHGPGYSGAAAFVGRKYFPAGTDITAWHVYAMEWTADALVFSVDGAEAYRVSRSNVETRGHWAYDNPKHLIVNQAIGGVYPRAINATASPYLGVPQSTVDLIKEGNAVMLVDWVRVTQQ
jgi:beta-glucanase (GH16 family)